MTVDWARIRSVCCWVWVLFRLQDKKSTRMIKCVLGDKTVLAAVILGLGLSGCNITEIRDIGADVQVAQRLSCKI